jgi:predicted O-methyltransferase YrrM
METPEKTSIHVTSNPIGGFIDIIKEYTKVKREDLVVAEVGVYIGATTIYSAPLVKHMNGTYLAIDWFKGSIEGVDPNGDHTPISLSKEKDIFETFNQNMQIVGCDDIVTTYSATTLEAAKNIPDRSLDICFIDADHIYGAIKKDILAYIPKVKSGGVLCGHDFESLAFHFFNDITKEELTQDYVAKIITSDHYIVSSYNNTSINQQLIRRSNEQFHFHPGVVKAVTELIGIENITFKNDNVWAVRINENREFEKL